MEDWEQQHNLPARSVLAVLAPDDTFWLAETCTQVKPSEMRICIRWLRERPTTLRRSPNHRLFAVDTTWDEAVIWRDCVITDLCGDCALDENNVWSITRESLELVNAEAQKYNSNATAITGVQSAPQMEGPTVTEDTFELLRNKCALAITQV